MAHILHFDIETSPNVSYTWGKYEQDVLAFVSESQMLCYAYKWDGEKKVHTRSMQDQENDKELIQSLWELFDKADIIVAHNGDAFDIKYANGRFLHYGLTPPSRYKTVDTLKIARTKFKLNSNALQSLAEKLNLPGKSDTGGFKLWLGCMANDPKAWKKMLKYNKQDVVLLEQVYQALRPWATNHPNLNLYAETLDNCPTCSSEDIQKKGYDFKGSTKHQRYKCLSCGANSYKPLSGDKPIRQ